MFGESFCDIVVIKSGDLVYIDGFLSFGIVNILEGKYIKEVIKFKGVYVFSVCVIFFGEFYDEWK